LHKTSGVEAGDAEDAATFLSKFGQNLGKFGQIWVNLGKNWVKFG